MQLAQNTQQPDRLGVSKMEQNKQVLCHPRGAKLQNFRCKTFLIKDMSLCQITLCDSQLGSFDGLGCEPRAIGKTSPDVRAVLEAVLT